MSDIHHFSEKLETVSRRLAKMGICEEDKQLIRRFVNYKVVTDRIGEARQEKYFRILQRIREHYFEEGWTFKSLAKDEVMQIVSRIERSDLSEWTKHDYELFLKMFLVWLGRTSEVDWLKVQKPKRLPDDLLEEREILALIDASENLRDKAFVAMLYEGGFRIGELGGLRIKDVKFDRYGAVAMVNGKTGMRRVRLIWSFPYIAQWMEMHPRREDRDAPLWVLAGNARKMWDYDAMRVQLQKIARRAGVKKRVNPHNFRHSRSTHLASKLTESQMEEYLGWVQGSKMPSIYVHMSGRDLDADLLKMYGLEPEEAEREELKTLQCPHCKTLNTIGARICLSCRKPLAAEEVIAREEKAMEMFKDVMDLLACHPEASEKLKKYLD